MRGRREIESVMLLDVGGWNSGFHGGSSRVFRSCSEKQHSCAGSNTLPTGNQPPAWSCPRKEKGRNKSLGLKVLLLCVCGLATLADVGGDMW